MKRFSLLLSFLLSLYGASAQSPSIDFYVTAGRDTVVLPRNSRILEHRHPQMLFLRFPKGKRTLVPVDSISLLKLSDRNVLGKKIRTTVYLPAQVHSTEGTCAHFVQEIYRQGAAALLITPYCSECTYLRIHYRTGPAADAHLLGPGNFREVLKAHFDGCASLQAYTRSKRYDAWRLLRLLKRCDGACGVPGTG